MRAKSRRGIILMVVLWVVVALSVMAFGFASDVQLGVRSIRNTKEGATGYFLAKAAINNSIFEMLRMNHPGTDANLQVRFKQLCIAGQPLQLSLDQGTAQCSIRNEAGKFDLNAGSPLLLKNLLMNHFGLDENAADDWVARWTARRKQTADALGISQGDAFESVEDASMFSGNHAALLWGGWQRSPEDFTKVEYLKGLMDLATVYSGTSRISLNYAPPELLAALPGVTSDEVDAIVRERARMPFSSVDDCQQRAPLQFNDDAKMLVSTDESPIFTLTATGQATHSDYVRRVRAIVQFGVTDPMGYRILYWKDEEF